MQSENLLNKKNIAIIFPAWTNCGTYRVVVGQIAAYAEMGANIYPIAISMTPNATPENKSKWRGFLASAHEIRDICHLGGPPLAPLLSYDYLWNALWPYFHGNHAKIRTWLIEHARLSQEIEAQKFDLIHCNHFFSMPVAKRLAKEKIPILLETHDIQARQFEIMNKLNWCLKPKVTYEQLLVEELAQLKQASALIHLNAEEKSLFESLLPNKKHILLYPSVNKITLSSPGDEIVMIAANNPPNLESICWLLDKVAPKTKNFSVSIYGDADKGMQKFFPELFNKFKSSFKGEIRRLEEAYQNAKAIILPAISGHGLSIKTVEALSTGLPLIATSIAFRGMDFPTQNLQGVFIADTAENFAKALDKNILANTSLDNKITKPQGTVEFYDKTFSPAQYKENLKKIASEYI